MAELCFFIGSLAGGGSERVCLNLANELATRYGRTVELLVLNDKNNAYGSQLQKEVKYRSLNVSNSRYALFPLVKYLIKNRPKLVVAFSYELTVLLVIARKILKLNFFVIARNVNTFTKNFEEDGNLWRRWIVTPIVKKLYSGADYYINQCNGMQQDLITAMPSIKNKTCIINNPVRESLFEFEPEENAPKYPYFLCVGRLENQKQFSHAIQAFSLLQKNHPEMKLIIIGKGSLYDSLKDQVRQLNLISSVVFEGFRSDVEEYYYNAKATLLTSKYEGFPNVLLESLALGTPVVAYDCPSGPSEIIIEGTNGYLISNGAVNDMAIGMQHILNNKFSRSAVRNTAEKFKSHTITEQYIKTFEK
ncbi:glycosyltransferase, partial [Cronobacter turicensis]|nr:glycosyltransferase [Cronobacter turicensis]